MSLCFLSDGDASTHLVLAAQRERQDSGESEHQDKAQLVTAGTKPTRADLIAAAPREAVDAGCAENAALRLEADLAAHTEQETGVLGTAAGAARGYSPFAAASAAPCGAADNNGRTPLHEAAANGHTAVVEALIAAGAAVNATDSCGRTPLHEAAMKGHMAVVSALIAAGAAV